VIDRAGIFTNLTVGEGSLRSGDDGDNDGNVKAMKPKKSTKTLYCKNKTHGRKINKKK